jgi:hypothetical protein
MSSPFQAHLDAILSNKTKIPIPSTAPSADTTQALAAIAAPIQLPVQEYDPEEEMDTAAYLGNFARLVGTLFTDENDKRFGAYLASSGPREDFTELQQMGIRALNRPLEFARDLLADPSGTAARAFVPVKEGVDMAVEMFSTDPRKTLPRVLTGAMEQFLEPTLNVLTQQRIVNGGRDIDDVTAEESARGISTTVANLAGIGIYTKLAKGFKALPAGVATTSSQRIGTLGRNIAIEARAQAVAGMAQEALANPDEFTLESVVNNVANPLVLFTSAAGGWWSGRKATQAARTKWEADSPDLNKSTLDAVPLAKQVAVTQNTTLQQAIAAIESIATGDNWLEAGVRKLTRAGEGSLFLLAKTADEFMEIYRAYGPSETQAVKPTTVLEKLPTYRTRNNVHYYFDDFDNVLMQTDDLKGLSRQYGIRVEDLKVMKDDLRVRMKNADVQSTMTGGVEFKYANVAPSKVPDIEVRPGRTRPFFYYSQNGTVMLTMKPLTKSMLGVFEKSGFLPKERVLVNGVEAIVENVNKNGTVRLRGTNGRIVSAPMDQLEKFPDGTRASWTTQEYGESLVDRFLSLVDRERKNPNKTFDGLLQQFAASRNINPDAIPGFAQFIYDTVRKRTLGVADETGFDKINELLAREFTSTTRDILRRMDTAGYRIVPDGTKYGIVDVDGLKFGVFDTMEEVKDFLKRDIMDENVPELLPTVFPLGGTQAFVRTDGVINRAFQSLGKKIGTYKYGELVPGWMRNMQRYTEDVAEALGQGPLGFNIARGLENFMNSINAAEQGIFKPVVKLTNDVIELSKKVSDEVKIEITRALEQKSLKELLAMMTPDEAMMGDALYTQFAKAGGTEAVKIAYKAFLDKVDAAGKTFDITKYPPEMRAALKMLDDNIKVGKMIQDERILRYVDALEATKKGILDDMTADEYILSRNWDADAVNLYKKTKEFYARAKVDFGIEGEITGYAPWITRWEGIPSIYNKTFGKNSSFIHELRRIGITPDGNRIMPVDELVYRYSKSAIHHKSPAAGRPGVETGQLLSEVLGDLELLREFSKSSNTTVSLEGIERWIQNIRGVPSFETSNARQINSMIKSGLGKSFAGNAVDTMLDLLTFSKLGIRPLLGARDFVSAYTMGMMYGAKTAGDILTITPAKLRRIEQLSAMGYLPQFDASDILSRLGRSKLSGATDFAMKASLQPQSYKVIAGNLYIHTFDKALDALNKAQGNPAKLVEELGDLLDSGSRASQDWFLETAMRDPVSAARGLAARNAHNLANRFGRLNNPLQWQTAYGRLWGQFGSWSLNALTFLGEGVLNSRSATAAARKVARMAGTSAAVVYGGKLAGLKMYNWVANPLTMLPGSGPALDAMGEAQRMFEMMNSPDERDRRQAMSMAVNMGNFFTPTVLQEMYQAGQIWNDIGDTYLATMRGAGFKITEERMEGYRPNSLGTGIKRKVEDTLLY